MNEPPGARWRVGLTALTIAEHFRDVEHSDVLLLMDNVFRFVQAGSEISGLLGRLPSRVGYQPTLATEIAELQERIASTPGRGGHGDPGRLCARRRLHRSGRRGAVQPPRRLGRPVAVHGGPGALPGDRSAGVDLGAPRSQRRRQGALPARGGGAATIARYRGLQDIIALLGIEELSAADRLAVGRARRLDRFLTQPFMVTEAFTGKPGRTVEMADTLAGCRPSSPASATTCPRARSTWWAPRGGARARGDAEGGGGMRLLITTPDADPPRRGRRRGRARRGRDRGFGIQPRHADFLTVLTFPWSAGVVRTRRPALLRGPRRAADRARRTSGVDRHARGASRRRSRGAGGARARPHGEPRPRRKARPRACASSCASRRMRQIIGYLRPRTGRGARRAAVSRPPKIPPPDDERRVPADRCGRRAARRARWQRRASARSRRIWR